MTTESVRKNVSGSNKSGSNKSDSPGKCSASASLAISPGRKIFVLSAVFVVVVATSALAAISYRTLHVASNEQQLKAASANYQWLHQTYDPSVDEEPRRIHSSLAKWLGSATVSDFSFVSLRDRNFGDAELSFLAGLRELRSLEIRSDQATDKTIELISQLPDLRYLSLAGNKFSIAGLLQLRNAQRLRRLVVDTERYTPIELAVLKSELVGVQLASGDALEKRQQPMIYAVGKPSA